MLSERGDEEKERERDMPKSSRHVWQLGCLSVRLWQGGPKDQNQRYRGMNGMNFKQERKELVKIILWLKNTLISTLCASTSVIRDSL